MKRSQAAGGSESDGCYSGAIVNAIVNSVVNRKGPVGTNGLLMALWKDNQPVQFTQKDWLSSQYVYLI